MNEYKILNIDVTQKMAVDTCKIKYSIILYVQILVS